MSPAKPATDPDNGIFTPLDGVALLSRLHSVGSKHLSGRGRPRPADPLIADMQRYFSNAANYFNDNAPDPLSDPVAGSEVDDNWK